jgi:hypothetical protein
MDVVHGMRKRAWLYRIELDVRVPMLITSTTRIVRNIIDRFYYCRVER